MLTLLITLLVRCYHMILGIGTPQSFPPPLTGEEERLCFERMKSGDEEARQKLILHNLRLVSHIVRKYYASASGCDQEDLVSIGTIGLVKAVDSFKPENGARFATYAARCIQNEILMHFRSRKKAQGDVSLSETIDVDKDGNPLTYADVISYDDNIAEEVERKIRVKKAMRLVGSVLDDRERQIILLRYGFTARGVMTQRAVADRLGISRSYVSRIEKAAIEKLQDAFGETVY
jgi:RNA polymerase sporulation-specific sigma factor